MANPTPHQPILKLPFTRKSRTYTIPAEMPIHHPPRVRVSVRIPLDQFLSPVELDLRFTEAMIVCKCGAGCTLTIDAVAVDGELVDTGDGKGNFCAVAANKPGCSGSSRHGR